jgi:adenosylmethionine-8-amino-7-oxononanoate aminotransferase
VRPFKDIIYLMPPFVIGGDDLHTLIEAVCEAACTIR